MTSLFQSLAFIEWNSTLPYTANSFGQAYTYDTPNKPTQI